MTAGARTPKVRYGRIAKILKLPLGLHKKIKNLAEIQAVTASDMYDQVVHRFLKEVKDSPEPVEYLFPRGASEKITLYLKERYVKEIKEVAATDFVPENRVVYTAIVRFSKGIV